jgi:hypothetical protein
MRLLACIIHEGFYYNRRSLTQARRARLAGKARLEARGSKFRRPRTSDLESSSGSHVRQVPLLALVARHSTISSRGPLSNEE